ncbi:MAG: branched-chain amino acid ABC transporter permease, partial [Thermodesulfobacteriota bacterium]|nr:branched-chain amino acid ABC transporter permease [Thermodesulfobacteriota bacterium]
PLQKGPLLVCQQIANQVVGPTLLVVFQDAGGGVLFQNVLERIRGNQLNEIVATFAFALIAMYSLKQAGVIRLGYSIPKFIEGNLTIGFVAVDYQRVIVIGAGIVIMLFIWWFTHNTSLGLGFRAIAQEDHTAMTLGINVNRTVLLAVVFGALLAGVAAILTVSLGAIRVGDAINVLIYAIAVSIIGGLGRIEGILAGSLILGFAQTIAATYLGSRWMMLVALAIFFVILIIRPSGIAGKTKELEERI